MRPRESLATTSICTTRVSDRSVGTVCAAADWTKSRAIAGHRMWTNQCQCQSDYWTRSMLAMVREPVRHWFTTLPLASTSMIRRPV